MKTFVMTTVLVCVLALRGWAWADDPAAGVRGPDADPRGPDVPADTSEIRRDSATGPAGAERRTERPGKHSTTAGQHGTSGEELGGTDTQSGPPQEGARGK